MGKIKIKKNDVWIDMTPMSDVMVLLLTFFMLSANFVKNEVVKVVTPSSETMAKVPASATLDITIDPEGRVLLATDKTVTLDKALTTMLQERGAELSAEQRKAMLAETQLGIPVKNLAEYLGKTHEEQVKLLKSTGIPTDSLESREDKMSEFQLWVKALKNGYKDWYNAQDDATKAGAANKLEICIKADKNTPYAAVKKVISELQDINESRYKLLTQYKKSDE
ncbi:MAG: biopolymer transporter ExbD [Prevotella sp.]|nr:biopolymer transporter ExbD [Prevotella sp.]MBQ9646322.1 biopolymer transporter ExbD [Prevotella sp.]